MWAPFLEKAESDGEIADYVYLAREESNFTDFYFISRNGEYLALSGDRGYLDLRDQLPTLVLENQPIVVVVIAQVDEVVHALGGLLGVQLALDDAAIFHGNFKSRIHCLILSFMARSI